MKRFPWGALRQSIVAVLLVLTLFVSGCMRQEQPDAEDFSAFVWELFEQSVTSDTITFHYTLKEPERMGITMDEVTWGQVDFSEEALEQEQKEMEEMLAELRRYETVDLPSEDRLLYEILEYSLETELSFNQYIDLYEPFAYTSGLQMNLPITLSEYPFYDRQDVEDYLQLLTLLPEYVGAFLDFERQKAEKGYFMAESNAEEVIRQCEEFIADPAHNVLIETFESRIESMEELSEKEKEELQNRNLRAVLESVAPTYETIIEVFEALKGSGQNELGLAGYERGKEYYQYLLASTVGTDKTPEEVIAVLEQALQDTLQELVTLVSANFEEYSAYFQEETLYAASDPEEDIRYLEEVVTDRFPAIPAIEFTVTPVHASLQDSVSPAFYMIPSIDAYQENSIYINEAGGSMGSLWATLAHEGIPGHMYQTVYFLSHNPHPLRSVLTFSGYSEGWATYVEMMSYAYYPFERALYSDLEKINAELNLLVSARIEIGVNYEGWSLEETQAFLTQLGLDASAAQDIMNYVIAEPVNYQMYCLGWLELEELYAKAQEAQGEAFDEVAFHESVLQTGPCPFAILQKYVLPSAERYTSR